MIGIEIKISILRLLGRPKIKLGGHMLMLIYTVAKNYNGKINSNGIGFCSPKCKVRNSTICFLWNSIHSPLS